MNVVREGVQVEQRHNDLIEAVIGHAMAVHSTLGPGYLESTYEAALAVEFDYRGIHFLRQHSYDVSYRGVTVGEGRLDILVADQIVVELKAIERILPIHTAQVIAYLRALDLPVGIIINFNVPKLKSGLKRITHPDIYSA